MRWTPNVTVAAVVHREGRFLLVEEIIDGRNLFNQPAGHWEYGESLEQAVKREVTEETGWSFRPQGLLGIYRWQPEHLNNTTFLRFAFIGEVLDYDPDQPLDAGIIGPCWMTLAEVRASTHRHRSPQVLRCCEDYCRGIHYPLELINDL